MRILEYQAFNYKGLVDVHIVPDPDQNIIVITGKNKQGKTSTIDGIWAALRGAEIAKVTDMPIRKGQTKASIRLDLGEYIVLREWNASDKTSLGTLTVKSPRGATYDSPQAVLDGLVAKMTMDPLAFIKLKGTEQVKALIGMLGEALTFDPAEIEGRRKDADAARAMANKEVKALAARLAAAPEAPAGTPDEIVSTADVIAEHTEAQHANSRRHLTLRNIALYQSGIEAAEAAIAQAQEDRDVSAANLATEQAALEALAPEVNLDEIVERLQNVEATNNAVYTLRARSSIARDLKAAETDAAMFDDQLDAIKQEKADALAAVEWPVAGLSFDGDTVLYNEVALGQASDSEKRLVGIKMAIAQHPELRVIRVDQGESLDEEARAHLDELAAEHDLQVWMTFVGRYDDDNVVVIHEGQVAA